MVVQIVKNDGAISSDYSYAYRKSNIGILNVDLTTTSLTAWTNVDLLYVGLRPKKQINLYANSSLGTVVLILTTGGTLKLNTCDYSGVFAIRTQIVTDGLLP